MCVCVCVCVCERARKRLSAAARANVRASLLLDLLSHNTHSVTVKPTLPLICSLVLLFIFYCLFGAHSSVDGLAALAPPPPLQLPSLCAALCFSILLAFAHAGLWRSCKEGINVTVLVKG